MQKYVASFRIPLDDVVAEDAANLAVAVAKHFANMPADEERTMREFKRKIHPERAPRERDAQATDRDSAGAAGAAVGGRSAKRKRTARDRERERERDQKLLASASAAEALRDQQYKSGAGDDAAAAAEVTNASVDTPAEAEVAATDDVAAAGADDEIYCICKRGSFGEMIACDNPKCPDPDNWYHLPCIGLTKAPSKWYCMRCKELSNAKSTAKPKSSSSSRSGGKSTAKSKSGSRSKSGSKSKSAKSKSGSRGSSSGGASASADATSGGDATGGTTFPRKSSTAGMTYCQMIEAVLSAKPGRTGTFVQICKLVESGYREHLNWKLESDRKTHVWKSSVRKILFSNRKFRRSDADKNCFTMIS